MVAAVVYTGAGGMLPLTVTSLVELPSPVQMVWSYARDGRRRFPALGGIYAAISPWFTLLYVLARVVRVLCRARASVARARASVARASACAEEAAPDSARIQCASWDHADAPVRPRTRVRSLARSLVFARVRARAPPATRLHVVHLGAVARARRRRWGVVFSSFTSFSTCGAVRWQPATARPACWARAPRGSTHSFAAGDSWDRACGRARWWRATSNSGRGRREPKAARARPTECAPRMRARAVTRIYSPPPHRTHTRARARAQISPRALGLASLRPAVRQPFCECMYVLTCFTASPLATRWPHRSGRIRLCAPWDLDKWLRSAAYPDLKSRMATWPRSVEARKGPGVSTVPTNACTHGTQVRSRRARAPCAYADAGIGAWLR